MFWLFPGKCSRVSVLYTGHVKEPGLCGGRTSILHYGPLIETNNLYAPTPNGNVRVRR